MLSEKYGWTPNQIGGMTTAQIAAYINQAPDPGQIYHFESNAEARQFSQEMNSRREEWINSWLNNPR